MKKFVVYYHAPAEAMAKMKTATPEEKEAGMKTWIDWKDKVGDGMIDFGSPMMGAYRIDSDGSESNNRSPVTGYSIIEADDLEEVKALVKVHPHLQWEEGCAIEVFECIPMS